MFHARNSLPDHEAAALFPLMVPDRYSELVESIRNSGLLHEIVLHEEKILDGRNRYRACRDAGVDPRFSVFEGDPFAYVWTANGQRRDIGQDQRYLIWKASNEASAAWQARQATIVAEANAKRSESQKGISKAEKERGATDSGTTLPNRTTNAKAVASSTNRGTVERMDKLAKERPDLALKVQRGEMKPTEAMRQLKKDRVAQKVKELPKDKYRVIYADPPWAYNDSRSGLGAGDEQGGVDRASTAARNHYPTMSMSEISALDVKSLAADDCVLFCWATFPLLPEQIEAVKAWGFKYKTAFVWNKGRGSFGHYHKAEAELLLVCTRGSGVPDAETRENQIQSFSRTGHSRKPDEFRALIDRLYNHGSRIELFRRGSAPEGWNIWGAEIDG